MAIFEAMSLLALEPLLRMKCSNTPGGGDGPTNTADNLDPADPRLQAALNRAAAHTWLVLEALLAGPALWEGCHLFMGEGEWLELSQHAQFLREKLRFKSGAAFGEEQRRACLREIHAARKKGMLSGAGQKFLAAMPEANKNVCPTRTAVPETNKNVRPTRTVAVAFSMLVRELQQAGLPHLARLLEQDEQAEPLPARAVQHFFQQELEQHPELLPGLSSGDTKRPLSKQRKALQLIAQTMTSYGPGLQEWIEEDMSEPAVSPAEETPLPKSAANLAEKTAAANDKKEPATPAQSNVESSIPIWQQRLGWLVGVGALVLTGLGVFLWLYFRTAHEMRVFSGPEGYVMGVAVSPDGTQLAAGTADGAVWIWEMETGKTLHVLMKNEADRGGSVGSVAFSHDGKTLLAGVYSDARLFNVKTGKQVAKLETWKNNIVCTAYSPDGNYIATSSKAEGTAQATQGGVRLWDAKTYQQLGKDHTPVDKEKKLPPFIEGYKFPVTSMAFSPDSKHLLAGDARMLSLWEVATGKLVRKFPEITKGLTCLAFAPDGEHIAFATFQKADFNSPIYLWSLKDDKVAHVFEGHRALVAGIAFSPDGRHLVSGSLVNKEGEPAEPRTIRLWSLASGLESYQFDTKDPVGNVAFTPDSRHVLSVGADKKIHLWWLP